MVVFKSTRTNHNLIQFHTEPLTTVLHLLVGLVFAVGHAVAGQLVVDALTVAALKFRVDVAGGVFSCDGTGKRP